MQRLLITTTALLPGLALALCTPDLSGQETADSPPLILWQRSIEDALALAKAKHLPILAVANQDGEIACDSLVRDRYRDPAFAKLANRYVAVIGSTNRHNPRDYDAQGRRIPCPRFGCVTCGEHIAIEPELFKRYFKGERTAPRHIGTGTNGKELFDRILDRSLARIDASLRQHASQKSAMPQLASKDRSLDGLAHSPAQADRDLLEQKFVAARPAGRLRILGATVSSGIRHPGLLRLGLAANDAGVVRVAEEILASSATPADIDLLLRTLGTPGSDESYQRTMRGLERAARNDEVCKRALTIRKALDAKAVRVNPAQFAASFRAHADVVAETDLVPNAELEDLDARLEQNTKQARNKDPLGRFSIAVARDTLRYALNRLQAGKDPTFLLQDAKTAIARAVKAGAPGAATAVWQARIHWLLNELDTASSAAAVALAGIDHRASPLRLAPTAQATAAVLEIYARSQMRIVQSPNPAPQYPAAALTEAHRAWEALAAHPLCTESQHKAHFDLLLYVGARHAAGRQIRAALQLAPSSNLLHEAFRNQALWEGGWPGLASAYAGIQRTGATRSTIDWFAGYAGLLAAEGLIRHKLDKHPEQVYAAAIELFASSGKANPEYSSSANHYAALSHGGMAKLALQRGEFKAAVTAILTGARLAPQTFSIADGLQNTMQRTTRRLRRRISKQTALLRQLNQGLAELGITPK